MPFQGGQGVDFEGGLELAVASVEVRRCVIIEEHSNHDSVECADRGVQMYSADAGWLGLDPTVGDFVEPQHIRVAYGRDYGDVPPVRGVYKGHAGQRLSVDVLVRPAVDDTGVEVLEETAAAPPPSEEEEGEGSRQQQQHQLGYSVVLAVASVEVRQSGIIEEHFWHRE